MVAKVQCGQYVSLRKLLNISRLQIASGTKDEHPPHSNPPFFLFLVFKTYIYRLGVKPFLFLSLSFKRNIYRLGVKLFLFSLSFFHKTYFKQTASKILPFSFSYFPKTHLQRKKNLLHIQILSFFPCFPKT